MNVGNSVLRQSANFWYVLEDYRQRKKFYDDPKNNMDKNSMSYTIILNQIHRLETTGRL